MSLHSAEVGKHRGDDRWWGGLFWAPLKAPRIEVYLFRQLSGIKRAVGLGIIGRS